MIKLNGSAKVESNNDDSFTWRDASKYVYRVLRSRNVPRYILNSFIKDELADDGLINDIVGLAAEYFYASRSKAGIERTRNGQTYLVRALSLKSSCRFAISTVLRANKYQYQIVHDYTDSVAGQDTKRKTYVMNYATRSQYRNARRNGYIKNYDLHKHDIARCLGQSYVDLLQGMIDGHTKTEIAHQLGILPQRIAGMIRDLEEWAKV